MADFTLPSSLSLYSQVWTLLQSLLTTMVTMFDGTTDANIPNKAKRYNTDTNKFQSYNSGTGTWSDLGFHTTIDSHINNTSLHSSVPIGGIVAYGGSTAPTNYFLCDGSEKSRTTEASLFSIIGTNYGVGDSSTTFNLPNLKGKFSLGKADSGTGSTLGEAGGFLNHTHSVPNHAHAISAHTHTMGNHTHSVSAHTHTTPSHEHTVPPHGHSATHAFASLEISNAGGSHSHSYGTRKNADTIGSSFGNRAAVAVETTGTADNNTTSSSGSTHTHAHSDFAGTVGAWNGGGTGYSGDGNLSTSGYGGGTTGSGGGGNTGTPSSNTTDSGGPTTTSTDGSSTSGANNPPFQVVNYIIRYQ